MLVINKTATSDRLLLTSWQLGFQWHRRGIELVFKSLDCFTNRLFHTATIFLLLHMYLWFETSPGWLQGWRVFFVCFFTSIWWGSTQLHNVFTICAVYWSLGLQGYFGVSNVVLVKIVKGGWSGRVIDTLRNSYRKTQFSVKRHVNLNMPISSLLGVNQDGIASGLSFRKHLNDLDHYLKKRCWYMYQWANYKSFMLDWRLDCYF